MKGRDERGFQDGFSALYPEAGGDEAGRRRKAATMLCVLRRHLGPDALRRARVLDVGAAGGVIAAEFSAHCAEVLGLDIDRPAIRRARARYSDAAHWVVADAQRIPLPDASIDIVVCAHVYEHVPDDRELMQEIFRVLVPGGLCYFAAGNRWQWMEPHHRLPLLSVIPVALAHHYLRICGRGRYYFERHRTLPGLRRLVRAFRVHDYTEALISDPDAFGLDYLLRPGSWKHRLAKWITRCLPAVVPTYVWVLERPRQLEDRKSA